MPGSETITHVSSVPEAGFERPKSVQELAALCFTACTILSAACWYVLDHCEPGDEAWDVLHKAHEEVSHAHIFAAVEGQFVGVPDWEKAGAA